MIGTFHQAARIAGITLLALPAAAEIPAGDIASLLRDAGCRADAATIQSRAEAGGFDTDGAQQAVQGLIGLGAARVAEDGSVVLDAAYCGLGPDTTAEEVLVAALRLHGCRLMESAADELLAPFGLDRTNTTPAAEALVARGDAELFGQEVLTLAPALCDGAATEEQPASVSDEVGAIVAVANDTGCVITAGRAEALFAPYGFDMNALEAAAQGLIDAGQARLLDDGFEIFPPLCAASPEGGTESGDPPLGATEPVALRNPDWPAFQTLLADHGCEMEYGAAWVAAADYGLGPSAAGDLVDQLFNAGLLDEAGGVMTLDMSVCTPSADSGRNNLVLDLTMEMILMQCKLTLLDLSYWASDTGVDRMLAQGVISDLLREGRLGLEGVSLVLDHPECP